MKTVVTLGGFVMGGVDSIAWRFTTGTYPYKTTFSVPNASWAQLKKKMEGREPLELVVADRSRTDRIKNLFIIHEAPSDSPHRTSFVVADKRILWVYPAIVREYNVPKRTGFRTIISNVPQPGAVTKDQYTYREYSLKDGKNQWLPKDAVQDILEQLEGPANAPRKGGPRTGDPVASGKGWVIESFPGEGNEIRSSLQNVMISDNGDVALSRLLREVAGSEVWIDAEGIARVFDATDLGAAEAYFNTLPPSTRDGDKAEFIHRNAIRPSSVRVFYAREVEAVFEYDDDYGGQTSGTKLKNDPALENVIPTVDPETEVTTFDYGTGKHQTRTVPAGTWVPARDWLAAMDKIRKAKNLVSFPWTFKTIREAWMIGDLDGVLGSSGKKDVDDTGNQAARVQALKMHFRQTFMITRRYMERLRDVQATRVAVIDTITGAKTPPGVWGQITIVPTEKGIRVSARKKGTNTDAVYRMLDNLPAPGRDLQTKPELPLSVSFLDKDLGVFRLNFVGSPYGTDARFVPSHLQLASGASIAHTRDLALQDQRATGDGYRIEGFTNAQLLHKKAVFRVMLSIMPGAPNNKARYHMIEVKAEDLQKIYGKDFRIQKGDAPPMDVIIDPTENTARFAWRNDVKARKTLITLLGLNSDDPNQAGLAAVDDPKTKNIDESKMDGFVLINASEQADIEKGNLTAHALAVAAQVYIPYADNLQGNVSTRLPQGGVKLVGNMGSATLSIGALPHAKVSVSHRFPGQQKPISRQGLFPESVRQMVLGEIPFRGRG